MKRKIACGLLAIGMLVGLSGCNSSDYDPEKYIQLGTYKGVEVSKADVEPSEEAVQNEIDTVLERRGLRKEVTDRGAKEGDIVLCDYVGKIDGVAFDNGSAQNQEITIGQSGYIDGFTEGLLGVKSGDVKDADVTFPAEYPNNPDMAGKAAVFTFTVHKVTTVELPEITDELVKEISDVNTVAEYRQQIHDNLYQSSLETAVWKAIQDHWKVIDYPKAEVNRQYENIYNYYTNLAKQNQMELDTLLAQSNLTKDSLMDQAKEGVPEILAVKVIAKKEGLELTSQEYQDYVEEVASQYGFASPKEFEQANDKEIIQFNALRDKVLEFITSNAVIK